MRKTLVIVAIIFIAGVLSGCMRLDIRAGIDANNNAYLLYELEIDLTSVEPDMITPLIDGIKELEEHYRHTFGFEVTSSRTSETYYMKAVLTVEGGDYEIAFAKLRKMLTDEKLTPFSEISMDYTTEEMQQLYHLGATVDLASIVAGSSIGELPPSMRESIEAAYASSTGTLTIELPGSVVESASGETASDGHHITLTESLGFSGQTQVELTTRLNIWQQTIFVEPMEEVVSRFRTYAYIGFGAAALGVALAVLAIVMMRSKKKQRAAQEAAAQASAMQESTVQASAMQESTVQERDKGDGLILGDKGQGTLGTAD